MKISGSKSYSVLVAGLLILGVIEGHAIDRYVAQSNQIPDQVGGYTSWSGAASNIQVAVTASVNGDTVWVAPGEYGQPPVPVVTSGITNMLSIEKWITVRSSSGNPADTIINAGGVKNKRCLRIYTQVAAGANSTARLSGFTLTNGYANGGGVFFDVSNWHRIAIVDNCIVTGNRGISNAGGLYALYTGNSITLIVSNCVIRGNPDGGMYSRIYSRTEVVDCRFQNNGAYGISSWDGTNRIERCVFVGHAKTNSSYGTALTFFNSVNNQVRNSLFYGNRFINTEGAVFRTGGAAIGLGNSAAAHLYNCTIVSNYAAGYGAMSGGIYTHSTTTYKIWNSIVRGNYKDATQINYASGGGGAPVILFTNSCTSPLTGFPPAAKNINADPQYVDFAGHDYRLTRGSPCINTGTNQTWMIGAVDMDGFPRIDTGPGRVDMGCYEYPYRGTTITIQ